MIAFADTSGIAENRPLTKEMKERCLEAEEDDFCDRCNLVAVQADTPPASAGFLTPLVLIRERLERNQDLKQNLRFNEF